MLLFSILVMLAGFALSIWSIETENHHMSLVGMVLMSTVSFSWWLWVMLVINRMINYTKAAIERASEIKYDLKEISRLLDSKNPLKDK